MRTFHFALGFRFIGPEDLSRTIHTRDWKVSAAECRAKKNAAPVFGAAFGFVELKPGYFGLAEDFGLGRLGLEAWAGSETGSSSFGAKKRTPSWLCSPRT